MDTLDTKQTIVTTLRLDSALHSAAQVVAKEHGLTMAAWIKRAVARGIQADIESAKQNLAARAKILDQSVAVVDALQIMRQDKAKGLRAAVNSLAIDDGIASARRRKSAARAAGSAAARARHKA